MNDEADKCIGGTCRGSKIVPGVKPEGFGVIGRECVEVNARFILLINY